MGRKTKAKTRAKGPKRFQFEINQELWAEMEQIQALAGMTTMRELLNNALTLLRWSARHVQMNDTIAAVGADGRIHELEMPFLQTLALHPRPRLKAVASAVLDDVGNDADIGSDDGSDDEDVAVAAAS